MDFACIVYCIILICVILIWWFIPLRFYIPYLQGFKNNSKSFSLQVRNNIETKVV